MITLATTGTVWTSNRLDLGLEDGLSLGGGLDIEGRCCDRFGGGRKRGGLVGRAWDGRLVIVVADWRTSRTLSIVTSGTIGRCS